MITKFALSALMFTTTNGSFVVVLLKVGILVAEEL